MIRGQQFVFQDMHGKVFIINDAGINTSEETWTVSDDEVLTLVDAGDKVCRPDNSLFHHKGYRILVTSSPKMKEERRWLKQRVGLHAMYMMKPWSREELVVASFVHSP